MPEALPPRLHEEIVWLLTPRREFKLAAERIDLIDPHLAGWDGRHDLDWSGASHPFFERLVRQAPAPQLKQVLQALLVGVEGEQRVAALCRQIDEALHLATAAAVRPFAAYYQELVRELSSDRYRLDSRFVQLTLLMDQGPEAQGVRFVHDRRRTFNSLKQLLAEVEDRALVLLGGPGSGKTTLLRRLQLELAWDGLAEPETPIPFFVPLNAYFQRDGTSADPLTWLATLWQQRPGLPDFARLLGDGRFLFLLDGLNELPHDSQHDYQARIRGWQQFLQQAIPLGNTAVFSCRSLDYSVPLSSDAVTVRQVDVGALTPTQIEQFLTLYLADQAPPVWDALRQDSQQLTLFAVPFFLRLLVDQVIATGEMLTSRVALLTGFVRRALFREIGQRHHHLFDPGLLLSANDVQQVIHDRWPTAVALPSQGPLIPKLESLAFAMQDGRLDKEARQVRVAEETALVLLDHPHAADMIAAGVQLNVLDKNLTHLEITYLHQLIQEYFAARILAQKPEPTRLAVPWHEAEVTPKLADVMAELAVSDPLPGLPATGWEETARLATALMPALEAARFVTELMDVNLPLVARCAALPEVTLPPTQAAALQEALLARIGNPKADLRARIAAAEALAELGNPHFERHHGPHGDYLLPPFAQIEGGTYPIGNDDSQYAQEKPAHTVEIAPFELAVFPVTNAEYALFMAAGGYTDEQWWQTKAARAWLGGEGTSEGPLQSAREMKKFLQDFSDDLLKQQKVSPDQIEFWLWQKHASDEELERQYEKWYPAGEVYRQPRFWEDTLFNHPGQPVVGICWFEAKAYCAWLSAQTGTEIELPTEVEWEAAAGGSNGRNYAYGPEFDTARCNTFETHIRRTTPVGVFPHGGTPEGIHDLSGNVYEWTRTIWGTDLSTSEFPYPYNAEDGRDNQADGTSRRVVRGGSWYRDQIHARAAARDNDHPTARNNSCGFRLVRRPPSHPAH